MPNFYDGIAFDCDATLSALEGIDQLAALAGVAEQVSALTHRAMNGEIPLDAIYGERLALIRPRERDLATIAQQYLDRTVPGARVQVDMGRPAARTAAFMPVMKSGVTS